MSAPVIDSVKFKQAAQQQGFTACGMTPAVSVSPDAVKRFSKWIETGGHGNMAYLENYPDKRFDPTVLVPGARTVISLALGYRPAKTIAAKEYQLAWYAYGKDYHDVMKERLRALLNLLMEGECLKMPGMTGGTGIEGRVFCDTAPVLERYWAWRCGLGFIGKNTLLIIPGSGSYFFLGEIIVNAEADRYDEPMKENCGGCDRCLKACPTKALCAPYCLEATRCLSYLTIEHRGTLPMDVGRKMNKTIYGCDICQRTCPWNRAGAPTTVSEFTPSEELLRMKREDWETLSSDQYKALFKGSAVKRAKYEGLMRNIRAVSAQRKQHRLTGEREESVE